MTNWNVAGVQIDCRLGDPVGNRERIRHHLHAAAATGARLVVFPECAVTGYGFESKAEALPFAEPLPGPTTDQLAAECRSLGVWAVVGTLERDGDHLFNACALVGPDGFVAGYRKVHLPCLGIDRFATPGDRPFAVHDLGGLRVGMNICYDNSFPESARVLTLLGADLIVLPTNWPTAAANTARFLVPARALENHVYYLAVNRVGDERGFHFVGLTRLVDFRGELLAGDDRDTETIVYGEVNPEQARQKQVVVVPGKHEVNRVGHRRPEMYGPLVRLVAEDPSRTLPAR